MWLGIGGQGIGVQEVPGSITMGTTPFNGVSFKGYDRLEREDSKKVLGLIHIYCNMNSSFGKFDLCVVMFCFLV